MDNKLPEYEQGVIVADLRKAFERAGLCFDLDTATETDKVMRRLPPATDRYYVRKFVARTIRELEEYEEPNWACGFLPTDDAPYHGE